MQELEGVKKELDTMKKADKPASRAPIQFSGAAPAAGAGAAGAVRGARVPSAQQAVKEKEEAVKEADKLRTEITNLKEELSKAKEEMQGMVAKSELDKMVKKREQISKQLDRLGWTKKENLKEGENGAKHKKNPKEFVDSLVPKLEEAEV